jgi:hypothetical protein
LVDKRAEQMREALSRRCALWPSLSVRRRESDLRRTLCTSVRATSWLNSSAGGFEAAQQLPDAQGCLVGAIDEGEPFFVQAVGEGKVLSTLALEDRAQLGIPIIFEAEKDQPLTAFTLENHPLRAKDKAF